MQNYNDNTTCHIIMIGRPVWKNSILLMFTTYINMQHSVYCIHYGGKTYPNTCEKQRFSFTNAYTIQLARQMRMARDHYYFTLYYCYIYDGNAPPRYSKIHLSDRLSRQSNVFIAIVNVLSP